MDWGQVKTFVANLTVAKDALHIYAAFGVQVAAALLLKRPLSSWTPWLCVLAAELINESLDLLFPDQPYLLMKQWLEAGRDILNTMLLPTLLLFLCRAAPRIFVVTPSPGTVRQPAIQNSAE